MQGLIRCGQCGRKMQTGYSGTKGNCPRYVCARGSSLWQRPACQSLGGRRLEQRVLDEVFAVLQPGSLAATAKALNDADSVHRQHLTVFELAVERARFEAERARRQFDVVEPENRLVARNLERTWETALARQHQAEADLADPTRPPPTRSKTRKSPGYNTPAPICASVRRDNDHDQRPQTTPPRDHHRDRRDRANRDVKPTCGSSGKAAQRTASCSP